MTAQGLRVEGLPAWTGGSLIEGADGRAQPDAEVSCGWSFEGGHLTVRTAHTGMPPLYACITSGWVVLAPRLSSLVARGCALTLDDDALAVFLRLGYFLADDTPFREIRLLGPGLDWRWPGPAPSHQLPMRRVRAWTRDQAIEAYNELLRRSIETRRPPAECGPLALGLTGGRDSRHLLLELQASGIRPALTYTAAVYPPRRTCDAEGGAALAAALGLPHEHLSLAASKFAAELALLPMTDFCADEHQWALSIARRLGSGGFQTVVGVAGGVLYGRGGKPALASALAAQDWDRVASLQLDAAGVPEEWFSRLLTPEAASAFSRERAVARLAREWRRHADAAAPDVHFGYWNRNVRELVLFPFGVLEGINCLLPMVSRAQLDFAFSLPPELATDGSLQEAAIDASFPGHRAITGFPPSASARWQWLRVSHDGMPPSSCGRSSTAAARCCASGPRADRRCAPS